MQLRIVDVVTKERVLTIETSVIPYVGGYILTENKEKYQVKYLVYVYHKNTVLVYGRKEESIK